MREKLAAQGPAQRPRLGVELTTALGLVTGSKDGSWFTSDGRPALESQVWGRLVDRSGRNESSYSDDGALLSASPEWLLEELTKNDQRLVFTLTLTKYGYSPVKGVSSVIVGLREDDLVPRLWPAKAASKGRIG